MLWGRWKGPIVDHLIYKKRQQKNILQLFVRNKNWCTMKVSEKIVLFVALALISFSLNKFALQFVLMLVTSLERKSHDCF